MGLIPKVRSSDVVSKYVSLGAGDVSANVVVANAMPPMAQYIELTRAHLKW